MERYKTHRTINVDASPNASQVPVRVEHRTKEVVKNIAAVGTVAAAAFLAMPRPGGEAPAPAEPSYTEAVQESVNTAPSYNPETDELVFKGVRVKPNNSAKNTPSEAVMSYPKTIDYIAEHPSEKTAIVTSAELLPGMTQEAAIALRDVDGDGDMDAIALRVK